MKHLYDNLRARAKEKEEEEVKAEFCAQYNDIQKDVHA